MKYLFSFGQCLGTCPLKAAVLVLSTGVGVGALANDTRETENVAPTTTVSPDNAKMNQRDRRANANTADQQKNNKSDVELTRELRQALVKDKSLSTYAHNVKIITKGGVMTLRGPVRSQDERDLIARRAEDIVGAEHLKNQLEVAQ